jgi:hypothetical protein
MKKILFSLVALQLTFSTLHAQTPTPVPPAVAEAIKKAKKSLRSYTSSSSKTSKESGAKLAEAKTGIEEVLSSADNQNFYEAWYVKGQVYNEFLLQDADGRTEAAKNDFLKQQTSKTPVAKTVFVGTQMAAGLPAVEAFSKAFKLAVKKGEKTDALKGLRDVQNNLNSAGSDYYDLREKEKDAVANAYLLFKASLEVHDVLKANKQESLLDANDGVKKQYMLVGQLAGYAGQKAKEESAAIYDKILQLHTDKDSVSLSFVYAALYDLKLASDPAAALKALEEGRKKYPNDNQLLFTEINHYLKAGKLEILIDKLKEGIKKEPNNPSIVFTLGNVYDQLSKKASTEGDEAKAKSLEAEAMTYYNKTLDMDSKNVDAIYSIGANFYNKAAELTKELQKLGSDMSKAGMKKYDDKEKEVLAAFDKALPYFQRAESVNANDQNTLIALKEIFARKNDLKMSGEFKKRLQTVQDGGKNDKSYFAK